MERNLSALARRGIRRRNAAVDSGGVSGGRIRDSGLALSPSEGASKSMPFDTPLDILVARMSRAGGTEIHPRRIAMSIRGFAWLWVGAAAISVAPTAFAGDGCPPPPCAPPPVCAPPPCPAPEPCQCREIPARCETVCRTVECPAVTREVCIPCYEEVQCPVYETKCTPMYRDVEVPVYATRDVPVMGHR